MQQISYRLSGRKSPVYLGMYLGTNRRSLGRIWTGQENNYYNLFASFFLSMVMGVASLKALGIAVLLHMWKNSSGWFISKHFIFYVKGLCRMKYFNNSTVGLVGNVWLRNNSYKDFRCLDHKLEWEK